MDERQVLNPGEVEYHPQMIQSLGLATPNANRSLDDSLRAILAQACSLLHTTIGAVYLLARDENCLRLRASQGLRNDEAVNLPVMVDGSGKAAASHSLFAITDTSATPNSRDWPLPLPFGQPPLTLLTQRYHALLALPLVVKDELCGAVILYYHEPHQFSSEELLIARMLNDQAALTVENARLAEAVPDNAVQEERQRLARELHDSVTQALYGISLYAEAATRRLQSGDLASGV